ncbi:MAG: SgcJ/EcaC family oxidoreductase [Hyphomicrobiaceae bacterium]
MKFAARMGRPDGIKIAGWAAIGLFGAAALAAQPAHAASAPQCAPLTHTEAAALFDRWTTALAENDVMQLAGLYSDHAELVADGEGDPHRGRGAILAYYESLRQLHPQASVTSRTVETGCNVATESGEIVYRVTGKRKGTRMLLGGRYMTRYRFEDGAWRIERHFLGARPITARVRI